MNILLELSPEEHESIYSILRSLSERAQQRLSLNGLLEGWKRFVQHVEQGYQESIYEYINDLSTRDLLQEIVLGVSAVARDELVKILEPWDDKFYAATREISRPLLANAAQDKLDRWWFRVPENMGDDFKNDLRADHKIH